MATYSTIKGFTIQSLASDPALTPLGAGTWASGGNLNTARTTVAGAGLQTAALAFGGFEPAASNKTESYDGTAWTAVNNMVGARGYLAGMGTQTAALAAGGWYPPPSGVNLSEEYNGTSWAEGNNLPATVGENRGCGTQTAGLSAGGYNGSAVNAVYEYDGTCWSNGGTLGTARYSVGLLGIQTAAVCAGGTVSPHQQSETYDGSTWTEGADLNTARKNGGGCGGTSTEGIIATGQNPPGAINATEAYDGTSWTTLPATVATDRYNVGSAIGASQATATFFGGKTSPGVISNLTEEFSVPASATIVQEGQVWYNTTSTVLKGFGLTIGAGVWASGGSATTGRRYLSIAGTQTSAVTTGASPPPIGTITETYNGLAWTTSPAVMGSDKHNTAGLGQSDSAAMGVGGSGYLTVSETWNGTSWSEGNNITTGRTLASAAGTTTAAILVCGETSGPDTANTEEWNGTSWSEKNNINTVGYLTGHGTASDSVSAWMVAGGSSRGVQTETWDGTSWSEDNDLSRPSSQAAGMGSAGTSTLAIVFGGFPSVVALTEEWNGTSWTEVADLATARYGPGGCGSSTSALCGMGAAPATQTITEEWTVPSSQTIKTFTAT
mgnify:CR=1 FL=1